MSRSTPPNEKTGATRRRTPEKPVRLPPGVSNPIDIHVGGRLRARRMLLGLSQEKLGEAVGLTFQQVQKYEKGANRVGSSRLYELSHILEVPVSFFFDGAPPPGSAALGVHGDERSNSEPPEVDRLFRREILEYVRAFDRIDSPLVRKRLYELTKALGHEEQAG